uniref:Olfactory receptor n=1 Tax=Astyanax mexicanus TaxID=7994 RepID=A0A3B1J9K4_ASTMX
MENTSTFTTFILDGYFILDKQKHLYFTIFLFVYVAIVLLNALLIAVIYTERTLHNPMFILVCHLSVNDIYGSSSLIPHLLFNLATQFHKISLTNCLIQIYCLHTFNIIELTILAVMGYDRYIAICHPLRYHSLMSPRKLQIIVIFMWFYPLITFLCYESLTIRLTFCNEIITKTHCINFELIKLSCTDITVHSIIAGLVSFCVPTIDCVGIAFSYITIFVVISRSAAGESRSKAISTCTTHLIVICITYFASMVAFLAYRIQADISPDVRVLISLTYLLVPGICNPIIYGIRTKELRVHLIKMFQFNKVVSAS